MQPIKDPHEAEHAAADFLRKLGFTSVKVSPVGVDGGIDINSNEAIAQVKWRTSKSTGPEAQQLYGARADQRHKALIFFSKSGYTAAALKYAKTVDMALFAFQDDRTFSPVNAAANEIVNRNRLREEAARREAFARQREEARREDEFARQRQEEKKDAKKRVITDTTFIISGKIEDDMIILGHENDGLIGSAKSRVVPSPPEGRKGDPAPKLVISCVLVIALIYGVFFKGDTIDDVVPVSAILIIIILSLWVSSFRDFKSRKIGPRGGIK